MHGYNDEQKQLEAAVSEEESEMSATKWSKWGKVYECTRCGYRSERKSNVDRHYRRIHCELKIHKTCVCEKIFPTKGEYYEHCDQVHPHLRHSWYITTEKYKIGVLKPETKKHKKIINFNEKRVRSSPRLLSLYNKTILNNQENSDSSSSTTDPSSDFNYQSLEDQEDSKENECESECVENECEMNITFTPSLQNEEIEAKENCKETVPNVHEIKMSPSLMHLPLKKRFRNFSKRKCLSEVTNFNYDGFTKRNDAQINHYHSTTIAEKQRAVNFISQIDFDLLDAVLNLKYLKQSNH